MNIRVLTILNLILLFCLCIVKLTDSNTRSLFIRNDTVSIVKDIAKLVDILRA